MEKKTIVISLGGSVIAPKEIDISFLKNLKKVILKNASKYKFIIVCGGGETARKYIDALSSMQINKRLQSNVGISATRINAQFMNYFFNLNSYKDYKTFKSLKDALKKQDLVFCGALRYKPKQTSDSTAAEIAERFNTSFINITNVSGLYSSDPKKNKNAKLISFISWKDFYEKAKKIHFKPGQHFVLDQTAAELIMKKKIITYIIGKDVKQLDNLLNGKNFKGTIIKD